MEVRDEERRQKSPKEVKRLERMRDELKGVVIPDSVNKWVVNANVLTDKGKFFVRHGLRFFAPFIDAIVKGGGSIYIKDNFELMSDVPGMEHLRDYRTNPPTDNRLKDDMGGQALGNLLVISRGRIFSGSTLAHEAAHQFHFIILPDRLQNCITALYAAAEISGSFSSNYQRSNEREYFAVGVEVYLATSTPDDQIPFDREWLKANDPGLFRFLEAIEKRAPNIDAVTCPVAVRSQFLGWSPMRLS
jgi:hypothetical protein